MQERHKATWTVAETEEEEEAKIKEKEERDRETPRGSPLEVICMGGDVPPPEENADLLGFTPNRAHLLLQGVYGYFPHHNDWSHLDGGVADDVIWKSYWRRLAAQSSSWYATPSGSVGRRSTAILAAEWGGVIRRSWKSKRPLFFAHVVLTNTMGVRRAWEIWARITRRMDL